MSIVLIVSKTQMQHGVCVGAINQENGELIRLHNERGGNLSEDAPYEIGDRWEVDVEDAWNARPKPHIEDKQTTPLRIVDNIGNRGIINYIRNNHFGNRLTRGSIRQTFQGCLNFDGNKNYINRDDIPEFSTQFWIPDYNLIHVESFGKHYYNYRNIRIKYVGLEDPIEIIPEGTIIRLSLANWWNGDGSGEDRCYLQLSGWYL
jgi:hypothetical protein